MDDSHGGAAGLDALARNLVELATSSGSTVSTAESCTAGLVASTIAGVPGASAVLLGGAVTYTENIKHRVLGVSESTLERYTAVSVPCAKEMAEGAISLFGSDRSVSLTGYAGPGGGTEDDPVGTVYIAVAGKGIETMVRRCSFSGDRQEVRRRAAAEALHMIASSLQI